MGGNGDGAAALRVATGSSAGVRGAGVFTVGGGVGGGVGGAIASCLPRCWVMSSSACRHRDGLHRAPPAAAHRGPRTGASPDPDEPLGRATRTVSLQPMDEL